MLKKPVVEEKYIDYFGYKSWVCSPHKSRNICKVVKKVRLMLLNDLSGEIEIYTTNGELEEPDKPTS